MSNRDPREAMGRCVIIWSTTRRIEDGRELMPGDVFNEARRWPRAPSAASRGELVVLSPEACVEILRAALKHDPALAREIADAAGLADPRPHDKPRR